ncbi:UNVERIFIED_CONTAM: hypothetical protein HDU68_011695 [Siphonaria sp. JEL0065]|nr:hypothetical protein HDU68_011695 [Siphonaria sp. JEL0065]
MEFQLEPKHAAKTHTNGVSGLATLNGYVYSSSKDSTIKEWDLEGQNTRTFTGHTRWIRSLSVGNNRLFSGSWDNTVREWNLETGEAVRVFDDQHEGGVNSVLVDENAGKLYSGGEDGSICVYDLTIGEVVERYEANEPVLALASVGGIFVFASHANGSISLFDATTFELLETSASTSSEATGLVVLADRLYSSNNDKTIKEYDVDNWVSQRVFRGHSGFVSSIVGDAGSLENGGLVGPRLFSGDWSGAIKVWDLVKGTCLGTIRAFDGRSVNALVLLPEHGLLVAGASSGEIKWFDLNELPHSFAGTVGQPLPSFDAPSQQAASSYGNPYGGQQHQQSFAVRPSYNSYSGQQQPLYNAQQPSYQSYGGQQVSYGQQQQQSSYGPKPDSSAAISIIG